MHTVARACLSLGAIALCALAGCGVTTSGGSDQAANTSPGTVSSGPVTIATDHTIYRPHDENQVTVTNTLATAIYAEDTQASCSILALQAQNGATWGGSNAARCPLGRPAAVVAIAAGAKYTASIHAGELSPRSGLFPIGTYRLLLTYATSETSLMSGSGTTTIDSLTLSVVCQGPCPTAGTSSGTGTSTGSGTPVSATVIPGATASAKP